MVIGCCGSLQANEVTESALFERIVMRAGEEGLITGAIIVKGKTFITSRVVRSEDDLKIFGIRSGEGPDVLTVHRGCNESFASSLSLAW